MITFTQARKDARAMGWTMRKTGYDNEIACYPVGAGQDHAESYFTDCPQDALDTIRHNTGRTIPTVAKRARPTGQDIAALGAFPLWAVATESAAAAIDDALRLGWF